MALILTICAESASRERVWADQLKLLLRDSSSVEVRCGYISGQNYGSIVFIDSTLKNLDSVIEKIDRKGKSLFLMLDEGATFPERLIKTGKVDGIVVTPFRILEVLGKIGHHENSVMWNEVIEINASMSGLIQKLQKDLEVAERLQKAKQPKRFPHIKGYKVLSRYFAGAKPGGDYFDLAESKDKKHLSVILSHSSSYGLSSAIMAVLMQMTSNLPLDRIGEKGVLSEIVRKICDDLQIKLTEKDRLSLFFGTISRRDNRFRFAHLGESSVLYAAPQKDYELLPQSGKAIAKTSLSVDGQEVASQPFSSDSEHEIFLDPEGKLVFLSSGFVEILGGVERIKKILNSFREKDPVQLLNELVFKMKSNLPSPAEMPPQDCTAILLDVESQVVRLAKRELNEN